jgi:hypothetical protein
MSAFVANPSLILIIIEENFYKIKLRLMIDYSTPKWNEFNIVSPSNKLKRHNLSTRTDSRLGRSGEDINGYWIRLECGTTGRPKLISLWS